MNSKSHECPHCGSSKTRVSSKKRLTKRFLANLERHGKIKGMAYRDTATLMLHLFQEYDLSQRQIGEMCDTTRERIAGFLAGRNNPTIAQAIGMQRNIMHWLDADEETRANWQNPDLAALYEREAERAKQNATQEASV